MAPTRLRRWLAGAAVASGLALAAAAVAIGPLDAVLRDRNRNVVVLAWDEQLIDPIDPMPAILGYAR